MSNLKRATTPLAKSLVEYHDMKAEKKILMHQDEAIRKIVKRIEDLEWQYENNELQAVKNIIRSEINNLRDMKIFLEN